MILVLLIRFQILFVFQSEAFHRHSRTHGCQTKLFYRNQDDEKRSAKPLLVPVISPIPGQPPLVVGASTSIKPTRMQWMTIEDSLLSNEKNGGDVPPVIALMDNQPRSAEGASATLVTVVGISTEDVSMTYSGDKSFKTTLCGYDRDGSSGSELCVRLVGVGRAMLVDFAYQVPLTMQREDDDGYLSLGESKEGDDDPSAPAYIIVARFNLVTDLKPRKSPVHAAKELGMLAQKLELLHADRRQWVSVIHNARFRLTQRLGDNDRADVLADYDGLGALFGWDINDIKQVHLRKFSTQGENQEVCENSDDDECVLSDLENFGLGSSASSFASLHELAAVDVELVAPFYSPTTRESSDHFYEIYSFSTVKALQELVTANDNAWSLKCTNTVERLEQTYDWMWAHVRKLKEEAKRLRDELRECGDECTDLFKTERGGKTTAP